MFLLGAKSMNGRSLIMTGKELMPLGRCENDMATIFVKSWKLLFLYPARNGVREEPKSQKNLITMMTVQEALTIS